VTARSGTLEAGQNAWLAGGEVDNFVRHWHVRLTLSGAPVERLILRGAVQRLNQERPFLDSISSNGESVEIQFWDEGESMLDVASLAMRLWNEHRHSANLPNWEIVGLEILGKDLYDRRSSHGRHS
jgi:hypothetical protein